MVTTFASYDGTTIGYRAIGQGPLLVCVPGGPGRAADYLGSLGGLQQARRLILIDLRGVGRSADPADPATLRADRLVEDLEALRRHLGADQMDLLAHSAGSVLATLYAAAHPERLSRLALITPGLAAVGIGASDTDIAARIAVHAAEPWHAEAVAAAHQLFGGDLTPEVFRRSRPLFYGRWDAAAQAHAMSGIADRHRAARLGYFAGLEIDVPAIRATLGRLSAPVLLYGGEFDPLVTPAMLHEAATLVPDATVAVQARAGHFPWVDDADEFATAVGRFLER